MHSRVTSEVNATKGSNRVEKRTLRDIVHDPRETFRVPGRLQRKEPRRLDHTVVGAPNQHFYLPLLVCIVARDSIFLFVSTPDGSSCGIYTRPMRFGFISKSIKCCGTGRGFWTVDRASEPAVELYHCGGPRGAGAGIRKLPTLDNGPSNGLRNFDATLRSNPPAPPATSYSCPTIIIPKCWDTHSPFSRRAFMATSSDGTGGSFGVCLLFHASCLTSAG